MSIDLFFDVLMHVVVAFLAVQLFQLNKRARNTRMLLNTIGGLVDEELDDLCDYVNDLKEKLRI